MCLADSDTPDVEGLHRLTRSPCGAGGGGLTEWMHEAMHAGRGDEDRHARPLRPAEEREAV